MNIIKSLLILTMLSTSISTQAAGWTGNLKVTKLVVTFDGGINVKFSPDVSGCISNSGYGSNFASVYPSHPGINRIKADLMAAYLADKLIAVYFVDDRCTVGESILGGW